MTRDRIELFGGLRLRRDGETITRFPSQKAGLLLACLALKAGKPQPREYLIDLLWPGAEIEAGRNNLSTLLSLLRRLLEPDKLSAGTVLRADRQTITLNCETIDADIFKFAALRERAARTINPLARLPLLQRAAALAEEEFLPGVYDEWAHQARLHYAAQREEVLRERDRLLSSANLPGQTALISTGPSETGFASLPPALASAAPTFADSLPHLLTRFFGREREQTDLVEMLARRESRLVTLLGAGGAGKTRLALQIARQIAPEFEGRVVFVPLADIASPALIPILLASALSLPPMQGDPLKIALAVLAEKPTLLILDNMEHLLREEGVKSESPLGNSGAAFVRRALERAPELICLVTSRQALRLDGEQEYYLPALALPNSASIADLSASASAALYVDRAQKAKADFALTTQNAGTVAALCRKLEGMPLAIEMAAAWIKTLPPARMLERLERQLEALVSRRRDLPARQVSMRAVCEWSYDLLPPDLQNAFARLSVFQGGWTLAAAEALIGSGAVNVLAELQERSLLLAETDAAPFFDAADVPAPEARYRMLEPLREFAAEKRDEAGEGEAAQCAHARFFAALLREADKEFLGPQEKIWIARLKSDMDNLRAALDWLEQNEGQAALDMLPPMTRLWELIGAFAEGCAWCDRILALPEAQERTPRRARALHRAGILASMQWDYTTAAARANEALSISLERGDRRGQAAAWNGLGSIAIYERRFAQAREYFQRSLEIYTEEGAEREIGSVCQGLGNAELSLGNHAAAREHLERSLEIRNRLGNELGAMYTRGSLANLARAQNSHAEALRHYQAVLEVSCRARIYWTTATTLQNIARVCQSFEKQSEAACLLAGASALRAAIEYRLPPLEREEWNENLALLRSHLGEANFEQAWNRGGAMSEAQIVACASELVQSLA